MNQVRTDAIEAVGTAVYIDWGYGMRRRSNTPLARIGVAGSIGALCVASMTTPSLASEDRAHGVGGPAEAAGGKPYLKIPKQTASPNVIGRPGVYFDCRDECKGTLTLLTTGKNEDVIGSVKFRKASSDPYGRALVKLNSRGRKLNKKSKVTVLARARSGKLTTERRIGLRKGVSPCDLVTQAEVAAVVGEPVDPGKENTSEITRSTDTRLCDFESTAKRPVTTPVVGLSLTRGFGAQRGFAILPAIYDSPGDLTPVSGVGDRAYFTNAPLIGTTMSELHAIKGDAYLVASNPGTAGAGSRLPALVNAAFPRLK